jgi:hypothetical protein
MKIINKPEYLIKLKSIATKIGDLALYVIFVNTVFNLKLPATIIDVLPYILVVCVLISGKTQLPK